MIIVREVFTAKPGKASKLASLFKRMFSKDKRVKVMTDLVGKYNTVVMEMEMKNLEEFEKEMEEYQSGKMEEKMDPELAEEMSHYHEMFISGRREIFRIV